MSPSRRTLLRAGLLGLAGSLAGCAEDGAEPTQTTPSRRNTTTTASTSRSATTERTAAETTTAERRSLEFVHRDAVFDRGVADAETWYAARSLDAERAADELDPSAVAGDVDGQSAHAVERFVARTDFGTTGLVAIQVGVESSAHGLEFGFVNREVSPPRVVAFVGDRDRADTGSGVSTLLVRVPSEDASRLGGTVIKSDQDYEGPVYPVATFESPNDPVYESVRVRGHDRAGDPLPDPGGALVTGPKAAKEFAPEEAVFSEFVRDTDFDRAYLLAVRLSFDALNYVWPQSVERDGRRVTADVRNHDLRMGLNPVYSSLTLARISAESAPVRGTARLTRYREDRPNTAVETETVQLSADPADWRPSTTAATTDGNRS